MNRDDLSAARNDLGRATLGAAVRRFGALETVAFGRRLARYRRDQEALRARYGIDDATPIGPYGEATLRAVERFAARTPGVSFAYTSGSTSTPKKIAFTAERLRTIKR